MPRFLERRLQAEYGAGSSIPYAIMNKIGALRGNKETPKGRAMERKHARDTAAKSGRTGLLRALMGRRRA
ncbi:MAG TPA: hypothetical protein VGR63_02610 [Casimicrobiaceae bacterium]|jgi:hypothetical protein|nr:hypothetical protein [Casimicrobiaceae bacterium]